MDRTTQTTLIRCGIALAAVGAVTAARVALLSIGFGETAPFLLFTAAIVVAAWFGGFGAGLFATVGSALLVNLLFLEPLYTFGLHSTEEAVTLAVYVLQGALIAALGGSRFNAKQRADAAHAELEARVLQRTAELRAVNAELQQSIEDREMDGQTLRRLNAKLEQSNAELQDFASVASHDLQEPLRKIQAFGDRLATRSASSLDDTGRDYLQRMLNAAERMSVLINDLLSFSRVTTKARPFQPVDLKVVCEEVVSDLEARLERVNGRVEIDHLPVIDADPLQMRQLLQNLIGNGLKFHRPDAAPVVRVSAEIGEASDGEAQREVVRLLIADNGIGFDEKYLDRIFNVFQRLHGRMDYEGTGIGLAVCRKIAQRHGGDVTARSRPGEGATFIVTLPLTQPGAQDGRPSPGETHYDLVGR